MAASPLLRGVAPQFSEAARAASSSVSRVAAASSLGEASALAYAFKVYASESVLAALRASTASAARRASVLCVACASANGSTGIALRTASELFVGEDPCLSSASAAADRVASSTAAPSPSAPSTSLLFALIATDWVRERPAISSAATAARGERRDFLPTTAAAARDESQFFQPPTTASSGNFFLTAADARAAAYMFPFAPLMFSSSSTSTPTSLNRGSSSGTKSELVLSKRKSEPVVKRIVLEGW